MGNWIVPFKGRNATDVYGQNFLWKADNVYVMDNHRAAAWCWASEIPPALDHGIYHIDRHTDSLQSRLNDWLDALPSGLTMTMNIEDYLELSYLMPDIDRRVKVFRWDNYLSIYLALRDQSLKSVYFATHDDGDKPLFNGVFEVKPWDLIENIEFHIESQELPFILNLDLDYFFCSFNDDVVRLFGDSYFDELIGAIARLNNAGRLAVITIALTATKELTGGWNEVENMAARACAALGHSFKLD